MTGRFKLVLLAVGAMSACAGEAQLAVTVSPPKITGQKAVVKLALKNEFAEKIESARATVFLTGPEGKMAGQATRWIIGGDKSKLPLPSGATNVFNFVVTAEKPFASTNISASVVFNRLVLEGGRVADTAKSVKVSP